ncbi:MAG: hypothetical protein M3R17_07720 [Bacteroidota bacterium]|nr:hypothetical protein [Bacteroidota bacterium]
MPKSIFIFLFLAIPFLFQSQETQKRILFRSDSTWYAAADQILFSSTNKGANWDTIFAKKSPADTVFFNGALDTATNVFISDAKTIFIFGWDGTMHFKTILFCSSDYGKTWTKTIFYATAGVVGVKYLHKISDTQFFLERRGENYSVTTDSGKTWKNNVIFNSKHGGKDERFTFLENGEIRYSYYRSRERKHKTVLSSKDGGLTWATLKN